MGCEKPFRGRPPYTVADAVDLGKLDREYGTIGCPRECGWIGSRCDFQKKHRHECKRIRGPCKICGAIVVPAEHSAKCDGCHIEYPLCDPDGHLSVCTAPRGLCGDLLSTHTKRACSGCRTMIDTCLVCTMDAHSRDCILMIPVPEQEYKVRYITLDEAKRTENICTRCGLAKGAGHDGMCITFIHMMERMDMMTPYAEAKKVFAEPVVVVPASSIPT